LNLDLQGFENLVGIIRPIRFDSKSNRALKISQQNLIGLRFEF